MQFSLSSLVLGKQYIYKRWVVIHFIGNKTIPTAGPSEHCHQSNATARTCKCWCSSLVNYLWHSANYKGNCDTDSWEQNTAGLPGAKGQTVLIKKCLGAHKKVLGQSAHLFSFFVGRYAACICSLCGCMLFSLRTSIWGTLNNNPFLFNFAELRNCVKVKVAILNSPSLTILKVSVDLKQHLKEKTNFISIADI